MPSPVTGLSERHYPTEQDERRSTKGAYPRFKKVNRRAISLLAEYPGIILSQSSPDKSSVAVCRQLRCSLERKLSSIAGPTVSLAVKNERLFDGFSSDFEFIHAYKLHKGVEKVDQSFNGGCACYGTCDPKRCSCLSQEIESDNLIIPYRRAEDTPNLLVLTPDFLKRTTMIYECTPQCGCDENCWNRVVQHGRTVRLEVFHTGNRGFGELISVLDIR